MSASLISSQGWDMSTLSCDMIEQVEWDLDPAIETGWEQQRMQFS